ncbi:hypothetical protein, partial [Streptomyces mirabilis]|uniref:hypothetical protein n=1 Tax=Streptomyces mirabilis TaxID=68239 RepID=UPI003682795F
MKDSTTLELTEGQQLALDQLHRIVQASQGSVGGPPQGATPKGEGQGPRVEGGGPPRGPPGPPRRRSGDAG